jgi:hypothetical protein
MWMLIMTKLTHVISKINPLNDWPTINANTLYIEGCFAKAQLFTSPLSQHVKITIPYLIAQQTCDTKAWIIELICDFSILTMHEIK